MNVKELKKVIARLPDDTPVLTPGGDHGYYDATASAGTALHDKRYGWTEDHDEESTPEATFGTRRKVLIVGSG